MLKFANVFQDYAVLQRGKPICVWGSAKEGTTVTVSLENFEQTVQVIAGKWQVNLPAMQAQSGLILWARDEAGNEICCKEIAIGEVWLAGGQSNMEFLLQFDAQREIAYENCPQINLRCYEAPKISYQGQENDEDHSHEGVWRVADKDQAVYFSAVGFYFAQILQKELDVPIGIISCNWGGTSASAWMKDEYLQDELSFYIEWREQAAARFCDAKSLEEYKEQQAARNTKEMRLAFDNMMSTAQTAPLAPRFSKEELQAFQEKKYAPFSPFRAGGLFETMLKPLIPYTIAGVIWYQGEEDCQQAQHYVQLFTNMIACWRECWAEELPFIFAQLTAFENPQGMNPLDFVPIRNAQNIVSKRVTNTYMVCTLDAGLRYDIHPKEKRPVGERMAWKALNYVYQKNCFSDFPEVIAAEKQNGKFVISFSNCESGIVCYTDYMQTIQLLVNEKETLFTIQCNNNQVVLLCEDIKPESIIDVQYAMQGFCECVFYNKHGLPAIPFSLKI